MVLTLDETGSFCNRREVTSVTAVTKCGGVIALHPGGCRKALLYPTLPPTHVGPLPHPSARNRGRQSRDKHCRPRPVPAIASVDHRFVAIARGAPPHTAP